MAPKALEFLVVDGEYSKKRIGAAIAGLSAFGIFIWLIVLSVKLGAIKEHDQVNTTTAAPTTPDACASITCDVLGEICQEGKCMCGTGPTCDGNDAAPTCDAKNNKCICGIVGEATSGCEVDDETCQEGECMCGSTKSCKDNAAAPTCDAKHDKCICGIVGEATSGCEVDNETCQEGECMCGGKKSCKDNAAAPTCNAEKRICMCGTKASCEANKAGDKCDVKLEQCVCGEPGTGATECPLNESCKTDICHCGNSKTCAKNTAVDHCDADAGGKCLCGPNLPCKDPTPKCESRTCVAADAKSILLLSEK